MPVKKRKKRRMDRARIFDEKRKKRGRQWARYNEEEEG